MDGEASGRVFLNIDEVDVEHYLLNNPDVFAAMVERHQNIILQGQAQNDQRNLQQEPNQDDADEFTIPRLGLGLRVDRDGILFTPMNHDEEDSDVDVDDDPDPDGVDYVRIPHIGVGMTVNATSISISHLPETGGHAGGHAEEMDDSSEEETVESDDENSDMEADDSDEE